MRPIDQTLANINLGVIRLSLLRQTERLQYTVLDIGDEDRGADDQMRQSIDRLAYMPEQMTSQRSELIPVKSTIDGVLIHYDRVGKRDQCKQSDQISRNKFLVDVVRIVVRLKSLLAQLEALHRLRRRMNTLFHVFLMCQFVGVKLINLISA